MFFGFEITLVDLVIGGGLGIIIYGLLLLFWRERKERWYEVRAAAAWSKLADSHWDSYTETNRQLNEAYDEQEVLRTQLEEAEGALDLACEDLADAEVEIEELEEESDGFEESAMEAFEQLTTANDLVKHTLAWSERVLDVLERFEEKERQ